MVLLYEGRCSLQSVGLVPGSCWADASLCSISCPFALKSVAGLGGGDADVRRGELGCRVSLESEREGPQISGL